MTMKRYIRASLVQYDDPDDLEIIGEIVDNDADLDALTVLLKTEFDFDELNYLGNFMFEADLDDGKLLTVYTYPIDRNNDRIRIDSITIQNKE